MNLENTIFKYIEDESNKLTLRHHQYHNSIFVENIRKKERSTLPKIRKHIQPPHWSEDKKFNPFYVNKHAKSIAHSISKKIIAGTYSPLPPSFTKIKKQSGGYREVAMYQIPDAAVSTLFYHRLLSKNKHRFSSFSYAYRNDRNVHFAIQDISVELSQYPRMFVAEFDFSKFFDAISHDYLYAQFDKNGFFISEEERNVIRAFLIQHSGEKKVGIPQGTSISLFLANLACWQLDKNLEKEGLQFARYADDTIIWSRDYGKISRAYEIIQTFSKEVGVNLNEKKSEGINLLCPDSMPSEFAKRKEHIDFLGYSISVNKVSIKNSSTIKIKRQISYILYKHLVQPLMSTPLTAVKIPANDRDGALLSAICEVRRYLYGNLTEEMISAYISGRSNRIFFKGVMSFYPIINDEEQMKALDGWLVNAIFKSVRKRAKLLASHGQTRNHIFPFNVSRKCLRERCSKIKIGSEKLLKIPSFLHMYKAINKGLINLGVAGITDSKSDGYDY